MNEIEIPLKVSGVTEIRKELKSLKDEYLKATDPAQMAAIADEAGNLRKKLEGANNAFKGFTEGSNIDQVKSSFTDLQDSIMNLDFKSAGKQAANFNQTILALKPEDFTSQIKGLGTTFLNLGKTLGIVGKQFITLGASILANPIFLLVAVITAIVAAILIFLNKIGVLKKILDTLMVPINALIQGFKDLTDWIGLTSYAAEENAAKMIEANDKVIESSKDRQDKVVGAMDYEIKMAKIYGKETLDMELKKSKAIGSEAKTRIKSAEDIIKSQKELGDKADKEAIKKAKSQIKENEALLLEERRNRNLIMAQDAVDKREAAKKEAEEDKKNASDRAKRQSDANKKALEDARKFAADRLAAQRAIKDIEISLIQSDADREIVATQEKYTRLIEDTQKNESYTKDEKIKLQQLYQKQLEAELSKQEQTELDAQKEKQKKINDQIKANQEAQLQAEEDFYEQYRLQIMNEQQREVEGVNAKYFTLIANAEKFGLDTKVLKEQQEKELADIAQKYKDKEVKTAEEAEKKKQQAILDSINFGLKLAEQGNQAIQNLGDIAFAKKMAQVEKGSKAEEELAKKQFKFNKSMQLAGAIVDAGKAITASLSASPLTVLGVPNPGSIAALVATAAVSATNIAKIASTQFTSTNSGGNTAPTLPTATSTSTTSATPTANLFGQGNGMNNVTAPQEQTQTNITVKAIVSETELTKTQNKISKINQNATL